MFQDVYDHGIPWTMTPVLTRSDYVHIQYTDVEIDKDHEFCRVIENVNINTAEFITRCVNTIPDLLHEIDKQEGYVKERAREVHETLLLVEKRQSDKSSIQKQLDSVLLKSREYQSDRDHYKRLTEQQAVELDTLRLQVSELRARLSDTSQSLSQPDQTG